MNQNAHLQRSIAPSQRTTAALVQSLDERAGHDNSVAAKEWRELRERLAATLHANERGSASAADVCADLYHAELEKLPNGKQPRQW